MFDLELHRMSAAVCRFVLLMIGFAVSSFTARFDSMPSERPPKSSIRDARR